MSDAAAWALGSIARQASEAAKGVVGFMMLAQDEGAQNVLGQKILEKTPTAARALTGDYVAQAELVGPVVESRRQAYEKGVDEYAAAKSPFERGWSATGTVLPEASLVAGGVAGLARRGGAAVVVESNATVEAVEGGAAAEVGKVSAPRLTTPDPATVERMLARLPERAAGEKTSGTLLMDTGGQLELKSGVQGPGEFMPEGFGFIARPGTATHVEGHTAAAMRMSGATEANLFINNPPCGGRFGCAAQLPNMLPEGVRLNVYAPGDYMRTFIGVPDPRPFPMRVGPWVPSPAGSFLMDNPSTSARH